MRARTGVGKVALRGGAPGVPRIRAVVYDCDQVLGSTIDSPRDLGEPQQRQSCQEDHVANEISPPEPLGFLAEAIAPFHAELADPARGAGDAAGEEVQ